MTFNRYFLLAILTCGSLANAQVPEVPKLLAAPLGFLNSIFSPKSAALTRLLDDQKTIEADDLITKEKKYFLENKKEHSELDQEKNDYAQHPKLAKFKTQQGVIKHD